MGRPVEVQDWLDEGLELRATRQRPAVAEAHLHVVERLMRYPAIWPLVRPCVTQAGAFCGVAGMVLKSSHEGLEIEILFLDGRAEVAALG